GKLGLEHRPNTVPQRGDGPHPSDDDTSTHTNTYCWANGRREPDGTAPGRSLGDAPAGSRRPFAIPAAHRDGSALTHLRETNFHGIWFRHGPRSAGVDRYRTRRVGFLVIERRR